MYEIDTVLGQIYNHSCVTMHELPDDTIDLTVTSPPYWNAIDYQIHSTDSSRNFRPRHDEDYEEYLNFIEEAFREIFRVHKPGSFCSVIIGTVLLNGKHTPLPFHFVKLMETIGWKFHQDIIWAKCTAGVRRAGSFIQNPYPGYYYPNLMTEYILIFKKPGKNPIYFNRAPELKESSKLDIDSVFKMDIANNIWHIAPVPPNQLDHPCPFPEEIPYRIIRLYSYREDIILDPFSGIGTTLKVAQNLKRRWIGYEITEKYIRIAEKRIEEPLILRKQLIQRFEKISYGQHLPGKSVPRKPFRTKNKNKG